MARILIADPDVRTRDALSQQLAQRGDTIERVDDAAALLGAISAGDRCDVDLVIADLHLPGAPGLELVRRCMDRQTAVVLVAAFGSVEDAVAAMRAGAADFVPKPFAPEQIQLAVDRALERNHLVRENRDLKLALDDRLQIDNFVSTDPRMQQTLKTIRAVAGTRTTVLITGESGTGKTLLARAIHTASDRRSGPFVEVNCGALPENLLESELFGHVRGAFTGAVKDRPGKFEAADGGTIFLDEIGTASAALQIKLLRVLQERVLERVGDTRSITVDVRVVLATNLDLAAAVRDGTFREDLFYRIHVVPLQVPPLRERRSDIVALAEHFLSRFAAEHHKPVRGFSRAAIDRLVAAPWPGNVRQLENVVERAVVLTEAPSIGVDDLPADLGGIDPDRLAPAALLRVEPLDREPIGTLREALEGPERAIIERTLAHHDGNRQQTAATLGINRSTLFNKMRKFGLL